MAAGRKSSTSSNRSNKSKSAIGDRGLQELAQEASRHLDEVLPGGGAASSGTSPAGEPATAKRVEPAPRPRPAKALVAHVSPGVARILANLLTHLGLEAHVADVTVDIDFKLRSDQWDVVFAQGTAMPYPGRKISLKTLNHCTDRGIPVVLLSRRGERLIAEAAESTAASLLEWPFSAEKVNKVLSEAIP